MSARDFDWSEFRLGHSERVTSGLRRSPSTGIVFIPMAASDRAGARSLHLVLSQRTRGVVGARELGLMKPTAYLVNTSRGPLVDKSALLDAFQQRHIAGAALDTFDEEPLADDDPLRKLDNVILTPHLGYTVLELLQVFYEDVFENVLAFQ